MRILNVNKRRFSGDAIVHGEMLYVNTITGEGFNKIFALMDNSINYVARKYMHNFDSFEDTQQEIYIIVLEGAANYDPSKGASLSTFLLRHIKNRMIDKFRKKRVYIQLADSVEEELSLDINLNNKIDLIKRSSCWDDKWKNVMIRIFVNEDKIQDVAQDVGMSPWGLTRAIRRKLEVARNI